MLSSAGDTVIRMTVSVVTVVIALVGCALGPTALARSQRAADAELPLVAPAARHAGLLVGYDWDYFGGDRIQLLSMTRVGDRGPRQVGATVVPRPGQLVVSPALRALLVENPELRQRYPGDVVGTVPDRRLMGPDDLVVWRGVDRAAQPANAGWLDDRPGARGTLGVRVPIELQYAYPVLVLGFLAPLLALMALLATIGGARRRQRLGSLRLIGLSDRGAKLSVALEEAWLAGVAVLLGTGVFLVADGPVAEALPGDGIWASDVHVNWVLAALVLGSLPAIAVLVNALALRSLKTSPLAVERRTDQRRPRWSRVVPLLLGCAGLVVARSASVQQTTHGGDALLLAAGLFAIGLPLALPVVVPGLAGVLRNASVPNLLAFRRLESDPRNTTRIAVGLTLLVVMSGVVLMFLPLIAEGHANAYQRAGDRLGRETLFAPATAFSSEPAAGVTDEAAWHEVSASEAVGGSARFLEVSLRAAGRGRISVLAVDCAEAPSVLPVTRSQCLRGIAATPGRFRTATHWRATCCGRSAGSEVRLPPAPVSSDVVGVLASANDRNVDLIISRDLLPEGLVVPDRSAFYLARPGPGGLEEARTALEVALGRPFLTFGERHAISARVTRQYQTISMIAAALIVFIAGLATLVSAYDQVRRTEGERHLLTVAGASHRLIGRSLALQVLLPVVPGALLAVLATLNVAAGFSDLVAAQGSVVPIPTTGVLVTAALALVSPLLATSLVLRLTRRRLVARTE